jgi:hypothetical protein
LQLLLLITDSRWPPSLHVLDLDDETNLSDSFHGTFYVPRDSLALMVPWKNAANACSRMMLNGEVTAE